MQDEGFCPNGNACTYQHYVGGKSVYCGNSSGGNEAVTTTTTGTKNVVDTSGLSSSELIYLQHYKH